MEDQEALVAATTALGEAVRAARELRGFTHRKLADRLDPSVPGLRRTLEALEAGQCRCSKWLEVRVVELLRLPPHVAAAGGRASRILAWRRGCVSEPVNLEISCWDGAPLLAVHAVDLIAARPAIRRHAEWAGVSLPFADFGRPMQVPARPATFGDLVGAWSEGYLTYHHPEDPSTLWRCLGRAGGYLDHGPHYGFLAGGPVCGVYPGDLCVTTRRGLDYLWPEVNEIDPSDRALAAEWTLQRVLGPDGLDLLGS